MHARRFALMVVAFLIAAVLVAAQTAPAPPPKPITQQGLTDALRIGGLTTQELIDIVKQRGVAFQITEQVETDLRALGAQTALIEALRANYRPSAPEPKPVQLGPLAKNEIVTLLQVGTPSQRIAQLVNQRGVSFPWTTDVANELTTAGADSTLLAAVLAAAPAPSPATQASAPPVTNSATPPAPQPQPATATSTPSASPVKRLASIKEVHSLFIDKMKNGLDQYLRAELSKQLPGRFMVVVNKDEADALMMGAGEQQEGATAAVTGRYLGLHDTARGAVSIVDKAGTVLWASEAGDRTLIFGPLKRGGPSEVASRLIQDLKKTLNAD